MLLGQDFSSGCSLLVSLIFRQLFAVLDGGVAWFLNQPGTTGALSQEGTLDSAIILSADGEGFVGCEALRLYHAKWGF